MSKKIILEEVTNKEFYQALNELPFDEHEIDDEAKLENMIINLNRLYKLSKKEIEGLLTYNEAQALIQLFCGGLGFKKFDKTALIYSLEDELPYGYLQNTYDIDGTELLSKIRKLTQFQSMVLIGMLYEFSRSTKDSWITHEEAKKIFMIS